MPKKTKTSAPREEKSMAPVGSIGWRVRAKRHERQPKITLAEVAAAAKVTPQSISDVERGKSKTFKPEHIWPIAHALGVNPYWLVYGKGKDSPINELSPQEAELIVLVRDLDEADRSELMGYAKALQRKKRPLHAVPTPVSKLAER